MVCRKYIIIYLLLIFSSGAYSQKKIKLVGVKGESISLDLTPKQALEEAIQEAKLNALLEAGVGERIRSMRVMLTSSSEDRIKNNFNEVITSEYGASVILDSIYPEEKSFDQFNHMKVVARIDVTVLKYEERSDPTFYFEIKHLKEYYYSNEAISFTFLPSKDGYLKIFVLNENENTLLYPYKHPTAEYLSDVENHLFKAGVPLEFPIHEAYKPGYTIELEKGKDTESSTLVFLFTKEKFNWIDALSDKIIHDRIANISPDRRKLIYFPVVLKKNK